MPIVPDGSALRRPLRSCAIGALILSALLAAWQFLIPGGDSNPLAALVVILAASICLSGGVGLAVSATRRLWRSTQRPRAALPAVSLVGLVLALPSAASAAGAHRLVELVSLLLALLASAVFSAYLIVTASDAAPRPKSPPTGFDADDPDAYVTDIPGNGKRG